MKNELYDEEKLQKKSIDELKEIAKLRRIENRGKSKKEGLIISILKSESSNAKCNYMKHFNDNTNVDNNNNNTNVDNNNNTNDDDNDDTYDDKIRDKISDVRMMLSRLGNIVTKNDRKKIKKKLYEIEKKQNLSDNEKEEIYDHLVNVVNTFDKKEEYKHSDRDDLDYFGIKELENLFGGTDNNDNYYKPVLVKTSFKDGYKYYESRGDRDKKLSVKQYFYMIMPHLSDLVNDHKAIRNKSNEWKIQLNMSVNCYLF